MSQPALRRGHRFGAVVEQKLSSRAIPARFRNKLPRQSRVYPRYRWRVCTDETGEIHSHLDAHWAIIPSRRTARTDGLVDIPSSDWFALIKSTSGWMHSAKTLKTTSRGIELGKPAAFLFHQIILDAPRALSCGKNVFPIGRTFAEENLVALRRIR